MGSRRRCCCGAAGTCVVTFDVGFCGGASAAPGISLVPPGTLTTATIAVVDHETSAALASGTFAAHPTDPHLNRKVLSWSGGTPHLPAPTTAATVAVTASAGLLAAGTYRVAYTWVDSYGETTMGGESAPFTVSGGSQHATITFPSPPPGGPFVLNLYLTDGSPGTEVRHAIGITTTTYSPIAPLSHATPIPASNTSGVANPTVQATVSTVGSGGGSGGLDPGDYQVSYTFVDGTGETTIGSSLSASFTVSSAGDLPTVALPSLPSGATGMDVYLYSIIDGELGQIAAGVTAGTLDITATLMAAATFFTAPITNTSLLSDPTVQATVSVAGGAGPSLQAGTFYLAYTFVDGTGETAAGSSESLSFTRAADTDVSTATLPALPGGVTAMNIYIADGASGTERRYATGVTTTSYVLSTALGTAGTLPPASNTTAPVIDYTIDPHDARLQVATGSVSAPCGSSPTLPSLPLPVDRYHCIEGCGTPTTDTLSVTSAGATTTYSWVATTLPGIEPEAGYWLGTMVLDGVSRSVFLYPAGTCYDDPATPAWSGTWSVSSCPPSLAASGSLTNPTPVPPITVDFTVVEA